MKPGKLYRWLAAVHPQFQHPMMFVDFVEGGYLKMLNHDKVTLFYWVPAYSPREMWKRVL